MYSSSNDKEAYIFLQPSGNPHLGLQSLESAVVLPETFLLMFPRTAEDRRKVTVSRNIQFTLHFSNSSLFFPNIFPLLHESIADVDK